MADGYDSSVSIPRGSLLANKLLYSDLQSISRSSQCILLGRLPHIWSQDHEPTLMARASFIAKRKVKTKFKSSDAIIHKSLTSSSLNAHSTGGEGTDTRNGTTNIDAEPNLQDTMFDIFQFQNLEDDTTQSSSHSIDFSPILQFEEKTLPSSTSLLTSTRKSIQVPKHIPSIDNLSILTSQNLSRDISVTIPIPENHIDDEEYVVAEKKHNEFMKKLRKFVDKSGVHALKRNQKWQVREKIYQGLLKKYEVGDIVKLGRALVLIKQVEKTNFMTSFGEDEPCDSRVYERRKEFIIVLRRTKGSISPIAVQMYDIHILSDKNKKYPDVSFNLLDIVGAHFYSEFDKSIYLSVPHENGAMIYILKFHNNYSALNWLYFIKQALGHELNPTFHIQIPDLKISLNISVPHDIVDTVTKRNENISLIPNSSGVQLQHSPLFQYLIESIKENLIKLNYNSWIETLEHPWFCFRHYDRLDWVQYNSELFFIEHQMLSDMYHLEFRDTKDSKRINSDIEPTPIEGFLLRLTNTSGKKKSFLRSFHKLSYFYTSSSILFFTKYYRAAPPSVTNDSIEKSIKPMYEVYQHTPFKLNDNGDINIQEFSHNDKSALEELERRSQHIIKAEAMIDLHLVKDIRAIADNKSTKTQKLMLCALFYGDTSLVDDKFITDSVFEIEMFNGGILRLQAPNKFIRDQWVTRLRDLCDYWTNDRKINLHNIIQTRRKNQINLKINEYVDSNIDGEANKLSFAGSIASPSLSGLEINHTLMTGYLYLKSKKHANFNQFYAVLCPGFLVLFLIFKRSMNSGTWKPTASFNHFLTIPISSCYIYSGLSTRIDLLERSKEIDSQHPDRHSIPRIYPDGWRSSEEEQMRCFTLWFGSKRQITGREKAISKHDSRFGNEMGLYDSTEKNPHLAKMVQKLGITGRSIVFMARSRQERELWTSKIQSELDRNTLLD
ncbi:uncharacterized protein RJT21DRAFT_119866 [Scheffersomyces amazonensis]|uniref:uncharacterized protein n=1 Tax=Scheffersomyces amazonensis TaxID=1078765 RepID=UPI00315D300C